MPTTPFTAEHEAMRDSVRRLVERDLAEAAADAEAGGLPHADALERCAALGVFDTESAVADVAVVEELARVQSAGLVAVIVDAMLGRDVLGDVAPTAVVDDAAGVAVDGGAATGRLSFVVAAQVARRCLLLEAGVCVDVADGWSVTRLREPHALRGGAVGDVTLHGAAARSVPVRAADAARHDLRHAAAAVAGAWRTWEAALAYAKNREAFGRPIGRFQVNRHTLARTATQLTAAQALVHDSSWRMDRGAADAAAARIAATSAALDTTDAALQLQGGYGYTTEFDVERAWRDAHALPVGDAPRRDRLQHARGAT